MKKIFLVDWVGGRSGIALLSLFSQHCYSTVLDGKSNNLLPFFFRRAALNYSVLIKTEIYYTAVLQYSLRKCKVLALNFIVLNLMYHALILA